MATSLVSAPWASPSDVPAGLAVPTGGWEPWLAQASDLLYQLTGRQYRGQAQSKVQIVPASVDDCLRPLVPGWVPVPAPLLGAGAWAWRGRQLVVVALPSSPVISVDEVQVGGGEFAEQGDTPTTLDPSNYRLIGRAGLLERLDLGFGWPTDGGLWVTYTHGIAPPVGGVQACITLATELAACAAGDGTSRIANFQTSVTREGVTLGAVNLRDALTSGLTGLPEVDLWIRSINPKGLTRRGSAWSPDHGRPIRVPGSTILPTPDPTYVPTVNLDIYEGDDRAFSFPVLDAQNQPFPLGGYTAKAQVRTGPGGTLLHEWSTDDGNVTLTTGQVTLQVADSETWTFTTGVYDLQLIDPQGNVEVIARGTVHVIASVTT